MNVKTMRTAAENIAVNYKLEYKEAARIIGYYTNAGDDENAKKVINGDADKISEAARALGIPLKDHSKKKTPARISNNINGAGNYERVAGEIVNDLERGQLPEDIAQTILDVLKDFQTLHGFDDLTKLSGQQWRAACIHVGMFIKKSGLLHDRDRERIHGGIVYDAGRVAGLIGLWEYMTTLYKHTPLRYDFFSFCGISKSWFYEIGGEDVTPERAEIVQKVVAIEEAAISAGLVDSRENPTGRIFYSKARLGWQETAPRIDININGQPIKNALPMFDD